MSINPPSDHDDMEPFARSTDRMKALDAAWLRLPPPVKMLAWTAALRLVAPALRRAGDTLGIEPSDLLQFAQRPD